MSDDFTDKLNEKFDFIFGRLDKIEQAIRSLEVKEDGTVYWDPNKLVQHESEKPMENKK